MKKNLKWGTLVSTREIMLWTVLLAFAFIFGFRSWVYPAIQQNREIRAQIESKAMELGVYQKHEQSQQNQQRKKGNPRRQALAKKVKEAFQNSNTATEVLLSEFMTQMTKAEISQGGMLKGFSLKGENQQKGYSEINFEINWVGDYEKITGFFENLSNMPYLVSIKGLEVKPQSSEKSGQVELVARSTLYVSNVSGNASRGPENALSDNGMEMLMASGANRALGNPFGGGGKNFHSALQDLRLTGTMTGIARPLATINGEVLEVGEEVAGYKIVEVHPHEVILRQSGVDYTLGFYEIPEEGSSGSESKGQNIFSDKAMVSEGSKNSKGSTASEENASTRSGAAGSVTSSSRTVNYVGNSSNPSDSPGAGSAGSGGVPSAVEGGSPGGVSSGNVASTGNPGTTSSGTTGGAGIPIAGIPSGGGSTGGTTIIPPSNPTQGSGNSSGENPASGTGGSSGGNTVAGNNPSGNSGGQNSSGGTGGNSGSSGSGNSGSGGSGSSGGSNGVNIPSGPKIFPLIPPANPDPP